MSTTTGIEGVDRDAGDGNSTAPVADYYIDPDTGFMVFTAAYLTRRGFCCGNGCRHCPYPSGPTKSKSPS